MPYPHRFFAVNTLCIELEWFSMPKQSGKHEVGETALKGVGVVLLTAGANKSAASPEVGGVFLLSGFLTLFVGVRVRNVTVSVTGAEVAAGVADAVEQVRILVESAGQDGSCGGGDGE